MNGLDMPPVIQACYRPGSVIELEVKLTAHHKGHFEYYACPISWNGSKMTEPDQACFDSNPLTFIEDVSATSPKAVQQTGFEGRGYIHPSAMTIRHKYLLPAGVEGDLILLQVRAFNNQGRRPALPQVGRYVLLTLPFSI